MVAGIAPREASDRLNIYQARFDEEKQAFSELYLACFPVIILVLCFSCNVKKVQNNCLILPKRAETSI
jgi:hypothetical protein